MHHNRVWIQRGALLLLLAIVTASGWAMPRSRLDYDDASRRIAKRVFAWNAATSAFELSKSSRFFYDGWNLVAEFEGGATGPAALKRTHTWGTDVSGSLQGAGGVGGLLFVSIYSSAAPYALSAKLTPAFDGNGNITAWLDATSGEVAVAFDYDAFGNLLAVLPRPLASAGDAAAIPIGFSTKYRDAETGLLHYGFRDYSPSLGRWLSRDPLGEAGGVNLYGFVDNDGVNAVDALGLISAAYSVRAATGMIYSQDHPFVTQTDKCCQDWAYVDRLDLWVRLNTKPGSSCPKESIIGGPRFEQMEAGASSAAAAGGSDGDLLDSDGFNALAEAMMENPFALYAGNKERVEEGVWEALEAIAGVGVELGITMMTDGAGAFLDDTAVLGVSALKAEVRAAAKSGATLPADIAATFRGGNYSSHVLQSDVVAYRFSGGVSEPAGRFLTTQQTVRWIGTPDEAIRALNLPPGATAQQLNAFTIPKGTQIFYGRVEGGAQGATQIFIRDRGVLVPAP